MTSVLFSPLTADGPRVPRASHRLQLLFPLLLRISTRLATLVPTAIAGLFGIFLLVAFSKKALLVSLFALFLTYWDRYKRDDDVLRIHKVNLYDDDVRVVHEEHLHHGWQDRKQFLGSRPRPRWPPHFPDGLPAAYNYTFPSDDFYEFLFRSVDPPAFRGYRRRKYP